MEGVQVNLRERFAGVDANLDDVQAGAEACSRTVNALNADAAKFNGLLKDPLIRSVTQHVKELRAGARDQRTALQELRNSLARLRQDLKIAQRSTIRPPPVSVADRQRRCEPD